MEESNRQCHDLHLCLAYAKSKKGILVSLALLPCMCRKLVNVPLLTCELWLLGDGYNFNLKTSEMEILE